MYSYFILIIFLATVVTLLIKAEFADDRKKIYLFKPLATVLIIIIAFFNFFIAENNNWNYLMGIILGLIFSLGGDIALMFKSKKAFMIGLVLFLIAHVVYSIVFTVFNGFHSQDFFTGLMLLIFAIMIYSYLFSGLKGMKIPVLFYVLIITFMMHRAVSTFWGTYFNGMQAILISTGACLFLISDIILAVNKFKKPFNFNRISLAFYFTGQLLIALSTSFF